MPALLSSCDIFATHLSSALSHGKAYGDALPLDEAYGDAVPLDETNDDTLPLDEADGDACLPTEEILWSEARFSY